MSQSIRKRNIIILINRLSFTQMSRFLNGLHRQTASKHLIYGLLKEGQGLEVLIRLVHLNVHGIIALKFSVQHISGHQLKHVEIDQPVICIRKVTNSQILLILV